MSVQDGLWVGLALFLVASAALVTALWYGYTKEQEESPETPSEKAVYDELNELRKMGKSGGA